jgi:uncharacterized damage-inducible protein DinB
MKEKFKELFEYNNYFNQKLIELLSKNSENISEKTVKLINHLINAQQIWNSRIINEKEFEVWQINEWNKMHLLLLEPIHKLKRSKIHK